MKVKTTIILLGVLLVLGIFLYAVEFPSRKKEEKFKAEEKKVFLFDENKVEGITLKNPEGEFVFSRGQQGEWRLSKPVDAEADQYAADSLVNTMKNLTFERILEEKPADLSLYGLDKPQSRISVVLEGEKNPMALSLGKKSPLGSVYVKRDGQDRILLVGPSIDYAVNKKLMDLRDRNVLSFEREQVERIIFQIPHKKAELAKRDGGWVVLSHIPLKANEDSVNSLLSRLSSLRVDEFAEDHPRGLAKYGLDRPWGKIGLIAGKDKSQIEVRLGSRVPARPGIYASATGKDAVFLLPSDFKDRLEKLSGELLDMKVFSLNDRDVNKFEIVHGGAGGKTLTLDQDSSGHWHIAQAFGLKAGFVGAQDVRKKLAEVVFSELVADGPESLARYGLSTPSSIVRMWSKGTKDPQGLLLGGKKGKFLYAAREGEKAVFLVPDAILEQANKSLNDLLAPEEKSDYELKLKEQKDAGKKRDNQ